MMRARAVVLSCRVCAQGDLSVVRALGRAGVAVTVVAECEDSRARWSRYTSDFRICPDLTQDPRSALACLGAIADEESVRPVLFPTADPDLEMVPDLRRELAEHYRLFLPRPELVKTFSDKAKFFHYARRFDFPIPATYVPRDAADLATLAVAWRFRPS